MDKNHTKEHKPVAEPEVQTDSLGQPNPAWELERKNMAEAAERGEKAARDAEKAEKDAEKAEKPKAA